MHINVLITLYGIINQQHILSNIPTYISTQKKEITIPGLPAEAVRLLIDFAYTRTARLTAENIELILPVADQYHVTGLLKLCCEYLNKNLTHENCIGILQFAQVKEV